MRVEKTERGELYVLVIGESASRDCMSAYSGPYPNTPWLDSAKADGSWIVFENAYSNHTHTLPALTAALSEGRILTGLTFPRGQNIFSISKKAGIQTHWVSNQAALGSGDSPISAMAHRAEKYLFVSPYARSQASTTRKPDEVILPAVDQMLSEMDVSQNNLLIIHLMGNHGPYAYRYPESFETLDVTSASLLGKHAATPRGTKFATYLTSLKYTDTVLEKLFAQISAYAHLPVWMLYFSDHGEDVFSLDGGHDFGNFTWQKARIPMALWLSDPYIARYPEKAARLKARTKSIFTNDLIYDFYLGLANIRIEGFTDAYDFSSAAYSVTQKNAHIAEGLRIQDDGLLIAANTIAQDVNKKLAMHRANTMFKARQGAALGLKNFEVDVVFAELGGVATLFVGHSDRGAPTQHSLTLDAYLSELGEKPEFLWIDVKNLSCENAADIMKQIELLDAKYNIKDSALLESSNAPALADFSALEHFKIENTHNFQTIPLRFQK